MMKGRRQEAVNVLNDLRPDSAAVQSEIKEIEDQLQQKQKGFAMFRGNSNFRRSVWLGVLLQVMQQFTGMNVVMYYAPKIFGLAGFGQNASMWGTAIVGVVNVLATFIAIGLVDRWGRRPMLIMGFAVMAVGMGVLGLLIFAGIESEIQRILAIAVLLCFITGFAFSAGPADLGAVLGSAAAAGPRLRHRLLDLHQLGGELRSRPDLPHAAQHLRQCPDVLALRGAERALHPGHHRAGAGDQGHLARAYRAQPHEGRSLRNIGR